MATEAQIIANRRNSQKSTGLRSLEGKAIVSKNAVKHGLFALEVVSALTRKSVNRVKNTAIGLKVQRKNPENAGMIGRQKNPLMSLMTTMNDLLDLTPAIIRTIIVL
jgi:hypothetical protein